MLSQEKIQQLHRELHNKAKENKERDGELVPTCLIIPPGGDKPFLIPMEFNGTDEKLKAFATINAVANLIGAVAVIQITDAWIAKEELRSGETEEQGKAGAIKSKPPSERKDRQEAVVTTCTYKAGGTRCIASVYRIEDGKLIWGEETDTDADNMRINLAPTASKC